MEASARCGVILQKNTNEEMHVNINESNLVFQKLDILEFSSGTLRLEQIRIMSN